MNTRSFILRNPLVWIVLSVTVLMSIYVMMNMYFDSSPTAYLDPEDPSLKSFQKVANSFGDATTIILLFERDSLSLSEALADIDQITQEIQKVDYVTHIESIMNATRMSRSPGLSLTVQSDPYVTKEDGQYFLDDRIFLDSLYSGTLISKDGSLFFLMIRKDDSKQIEPQQIVQDLKDIVHPMTQMSFSILGEQIVNYEIFQSLNVMTFTYPPLILLIILVLYFWKLRNLYLSFLTLIPPVLGSIWVLFLMLLTGRNMNSLTVMIPSFILIVGTAYGMHFLTRWVENASNGLSHTSLVKMTRKDEMIPIYFSALTTTAGFSSYIFINSQAFRDMGIFVSLGILFSAVFTIGLLPNLANIPKIPQSIALKEKRVLRTFLRYKRLFFWATIFVLVLSPFLIARIPLQVDQYVFFRKSSPTMQASRKMRESFGWITNYTFMVERKDSSFFYLTSEEAQELKLLLDEIAQFPKIAHTQSIWDISDRLNLPVPLLIGGLRVSADPMAQSLLASDAMRVMLMSSESDSISASLTQTYILEKIAEHPSLSETFTFTLASAALIWSNLNATVVENQIQSLVIAFALILILLIIIFRNLKIAFLSTIPILITVLFNFLFMSLLQIPLQISTAMISGMLMGLIIDYSIHYMVWWRREKDAEKALARTSTPILANSLALMGSFALLLTAPLLLYVHVSILMILSIAVGMGATLWFMPAMLHQKSVPSKPKNQ